jgi:hypothetical protein
VSLELTLFLEFLKLFVNIRLVASFTGKKLHFLDLRINSYGCLKFLGEVWARRACVGANEEELTKHQKIWVQGGGGKGEGVGKMRDPWERGLRPATALRPAATGCWSAPLGDCRLAAAAAC